MNRARWNPQYYQKVLSLDPIAYWIQDEKQGNVAYDLVSGRVDGAQNGAITGVTLGQPGIGDGRTSFFYDGANDYVDILTPTFQATFNGLEGTVNVFSQVSGGGVWTDGATRYMVRVRVDGDNQLWINKTVNADQLQFRYEGSNVVKVVTHSTSTQNWFMATLSWSFSAGANGQAIAYINGLQTGAIQTNLGAWVGVPTISTIGSGNVTPTSVWDGLIEHVSIFDRALSSSEIAFLYQESF